MKLLKNSVLALAIVASLTACDKNEVYETSVTRNLSMTLDGEPYSIYYGTDANSKPLFIYKDNGDYYSHIGTSYRFALPDGNYRVFATNQATLIEEPSKNLGEQIIEQDPAAKQTFAFSTPVAYSAGADMSIALETRTGVLRLRALDEKADKSYNKLRATFSTPVVAYHVGNGAPVVAEPIEIVLENATSGGGIGYTQDAVLIGCESETVKVTIEYVNAAGEVIKTKTFDKDFTVLPNQMTEVAFNLNNADEQVVIGCTVNIGQINWRENNVVASVKVDVPDGFNYVEPSARFDDVYNALNADASVDEIKIFLKAGSTYTASANTLRGITKPVTILGQTPGFGQSKATLRLQGTADLTGTVDKIRFEKLNLAPATAQVFNIARSLHFSLGALEVVECEFNAFSGNLWLQASSTANSQKVGSFLIDGCSFVNYSAPTTGLLAPVNNRDNAISSITIRNSVFHARNFGTGTVVLGRLNYVTTPLAVVVEGNTFVDARGTNCTYFDIDPAKSPSFSLTVTGNTVAGVNSGVGTWFKLSSKATDVTASGNTRAKGYSMKAYGVAEPTEDARTYEEILSDLNI